MKRYVVLRIDDIFRMIADYAGEALELPADAQPTKFRLVQGKLQLMIEADSWEHDQPAEEIRVDMKRVYGL